MVVSKNKGLSKGGKKGSKVVDPFSRKDWYDIKAPSMFANRQVGKTLVNRIQGTKIASEGLKHRVFEVSVADLQNDQDAERSFRKFRFDQLPWNGFDDRQIALHGQEMADEFFHGDSVTCRIGLGWQIVFQKQNE